MEVGTSIDINVTTAMEIENGEDIIDYTDTCNGN